MALVEPCFNLACLAIFTRITPQGRDIDHVGKFVFHKCSFISHSQAWENHPRNASKYVMLYFSCIFSTICALDWPLSAWQFACVRKYFSTHYILSSLGQRKPSKSREGAHAFRGTFICKRAQCKLKWGILHTIFVKKLGGGHLSPESPSSYIHVSALIWGLENGSVRTLCMDIHYCD